MKKTVLSLSVVLALSGFFAAPVAQASEEESIAASVIEFLTHTLYPDSSMLASKEPVLFVPATDLDDSTVDANKYLVLSSLSSTAASIVGAINIDTASLTDEGATQNSKRKNNIANFSNNQMALFLCSQSSEKCLFDPKYSHGLINTLVGNPYGSSKAALTAPDNLLTSSEGQTKVDLFVDGNPSTNSSSQSNKFQYFDYEQVFGPHEPASLNPAKYYGMYVTGAYDVALLPEQLNLAEQLKNVLQSGNIIALRRNSVYQQYMLLTRKLTAINSALMSNILWLAKQHAVTVTAEKSPTGKKMSQAQVDDYIGNHRLRDNGEWLEKIKNESPTELLREQTLLMAEANHQREENNQLLKRLLATATIAAAEGKEIYQVSAALKARLGSGK